MNVSEQGSGIIRIMFWIEKPGSHIYDVTGDTNKEVVVKSPSESF